MQAGRELNILVAERVMGHHVVPFVRTWPSGYSETYYYLDRIASGRELPPYSNSIEAAWLVVEKLELFVYGDLNQNPWSYDYAPYGDSCEWQVTGETAPHVICLATLKYNAITPDTDKGAT